MSETKAARTGSGEKKGDILVVLEKQTSGGVSIEATSTVEALFGEQIRERAGETLRELGIEHAHLVAEDNGAYDYVIMARIEAAARRLWDVAEPGCPPARKVPVASPVRDRLRRTRLYMPGNDPNLMFGGGRYGADTVILDLEDSVAPAQKDAARVLVRNTLLSVDYAGAERIVRINPLSTEYGAADIRMIVPAGPDTILIPKCDCAGDVAAVEEIVARVEAEHGIAEPRLLMPLIETARGVLNAAEIAAASDRVCALCFGAEDFTADLGVERTREGTESFVARSLIVLGAKAAGVQAIDTVYSAFKDTEGLVESTREAMMLGFEGKGVIHPSQIEPIHEVFRPTPERIEYAKSVVAAIEEARAKGSGVATIKSKMIDRPIEMRARKILRLAGALGLLDEGDAG
ncbi:MAG: HpcH/HpaI aldolase/citrate lyase family protein [Candidatus Krumholzibacteriota bacterium]|nr:HpcH/HpaI aldolase/citrate lyase family protein [Candidatus Krumholzibacteriota bacterium]